MIVSNHGTIVGLPEKYESGEEYSLEAIADEGYSFIGWYIDDELISTSKEFIYIPSKASTLEARFTISTTFGVTIHYDAFSIEYGSVSSGFPASELNIENKYVKPNYLFLDYYVGIYLESNYMGRYQNTSSVTLSSLSANDWVYIEDTIYYKSGFTLVEATDLSSLGAITTHLDITPVFVPIYNTVTLVLDNGQQNITLEFIQNSPFTTITPTKEGYSFLSWRLNSPTGPIFNLNTLVTEDIVLYATWEERENGNHYPYTGNYYDGINFNNFTQIEEDKLSALLAQQVERGYSSGSSRETVGNAAVDPDNPNNIILIYNGASISNDNWNQEHVWPRATLPNSVEGDRHNLYPCDYDINNQRSSLKFMDGSGSYKKVSGGWYPGDEWIGDVARICMYMSFRYSINISSVLSESLALQWHEEDPVSKIEMRRNDLTYSSGDHDNRNPFVDNPELVYLIFGSNSSRTQKQDTNYNYDNITIHVILDNKRTLFIDKKEVM